MHQKRSLPRTVEIVTKSGRVLNVDPLLLPREAHGRPLTAFNDPLLNQVVERAAEAGIDLPHHDSKSRANGAKRVSRGAGRWHDILRHLTRR